MFYQGNIDNNLRFGDVLKGFITSFVKMKDPILNSSKVYEYNIEVSMPEFTVVVSPCCSIGPTIISLTPLLKIISPFFKNPFFISDFTRINRIMLPEKSLPLAEWNDLSPEERTRRKSLGLQYALVDFFIYEENEIFPEYTRRSHTIRYYMIDFKKIFHINCHKIKRNGEIEEGLLASKWLQLSVDARSDLRAKISNYYGRIPDEDEILL